MKDRLARMEQMVVANKTASQNQQKLETLLDEMRLTDQAGQMEKLLPFFGVNSTGKQLDGHDQPEELVQLSANANTAETDELDMHSVSSRSSSTSTSSDASLVSVPAEDVDSTWMVVKKESFKKLCDFYEKRRRVESNGGTVAADPFSDQLEREFHEAMKAADAELDDDDESNKTAPVPVPSAPTMQPSAEDGSVESQMDDDAIVVVEPPPAAVEEAQIVDLGCTDNNDSSEKSAKEVGCVHAVVMRGVCAACGQDFRQPNELVGHSATILGLQQHSKPADNVAAASHPIGGQPQQRLYPMLDSADQRPSGLRQCPWSSMFPRANGPYLLPSYEHHPRLARMEQMVVANKTASRSTATTTTPCVKPTAMPSAPPSATSTSSVQQSQQKTANNANDNKGVGLGQHGRRVDYLMGIGQSVQHALKNFGIECDAEVRDERGVLHGTVPFHRRPTENNNSSSNGTTHQQHKEKPNKKIHTKNPILVHEPPFANVGILQRRQLRTDSSRTAKLFIFGIILICCINFIDGTDKEIDEDTFAKIAARPPPRKCPPHCTTSTTDQPEQTTQKQKYNPGGGWDYVFVGFLVFAFVGSVALIYYNREACFHSLKNCSTQQSDGDQETGKGRVAPAQSDWGGRQNICPKMIIRKDLEVPPTTMRPNLPVSITAQQKDFEVPLNPTPQVEASSSVKAPRPSQEHVFGGTSAYMTGGKEREEILGADDFEQFQRERERIGLFVSNTPIYSNPTSVPTGGLTGTGRTPISGETNGASIGAETQICTLLNSTKCGKESLDIINRSPGTANCDSTGGESAVAVNGQSP